MGREGEKRGRGREEASSLHDFSVDFGFGIALKARDSTFGSGQGIILLDNVMCQGSEDSLLACSHNSVFRTNCDHSEDAAVICGGTSI